MEHHTFTIEVCAEHKQRIEQVAEFFGWDDAESLIGAMLAHELSRVEGLMHADLFRMHLDDFKQIIDERAQREDRNRLN